MSKFRGKSTLGSMAFGFLFLSTLLTVQSQKAEAAQAYFEPVEYEQPSGEKFTGHLSGDEKFNYVVTLEGEIIEKGADNYWYYTTIEQKARSSVSEIVPSDSKVEIDKKPIEAITQDNLSSIPNLMPEDSSLSEPELSEAELSSSVLTKEHKLLVLLVEFNDAKLLYPESQWNTLLFDKQNKSLKNYYATQTNNRLNIVPAAETSGTNDGIIKVKLNRNHPNTRTTVDSRNQVVVKEALIAADSFIDFSIYDTNNNGIIEANELHIMTILAGEESSIDSAQTAATSVWGHKWTIGTSNVTLDGKKFNSYTQFGESHKVSMDKPDLRIASIGIIVHELGHDLGLPDLYNTGEQSNGYGLGYMSVMASGSWGALKGEPAGSTPVGLDAYSKKLLGLPIETLDPSKTLTDKSVQSITKGDPTILEIPSELENEYFLVENREMVGYDAGGVRNEAIYSGGIAIYRVNEKLSANIDVGNQLVTALEANKGILGYSLYDSNKLWPGDPYFYKGIGKHGVNQLAELNKNTTPSTQLSNGSFSDFSLTVKSSPGSIMNIDFKGRNIPVESLTLSPSTASVAVGKTQQLNASVFPINASNKKVIWSTADNSVATISASGLVTGIKAGNTTITAKTEDGQKTAICKITVEAERIVPTSIGITGGYWGELAPGQGTANTTIRVLPENAANKEVIWTSSNPSVLTVDQNGNVKAIKPGTSTIKVTTVEGNVSKEIVRTVYQPFNSFNVSDAEKILLVNNTFKLSGVFTPTDATYQEVKWTSSDPAIATVDESGQVKAIKEGTVTITAKTVGPQTLSRTSKITVVNPQDDVTDKFLASGLTYLSTGTKLNGTIDFQGDEDVYRLMSNNSADFIPFLAVEDTQGNKIGFSVYDKNKNLVYDSKMDTKVFTELSPTGENAYYVKIKGESPTGVTKYRIYMDRKITTADNYSPIFSLPAITIGGSYSGILMPNSYRNYYQFVAPEAGTFEFTVKNHYARVYDAEWNLVDSAGVGGGRSVVSKDMKKGETAYVEAYVCYTTISDYTLTVAKK